MKTASSSVLSRFVPAAGRGFRRVAAGCLSLAVPFAAAAAGDPAPPRPLRVVATIFPAWDWTREVLGADAAGVELSALEWNGVDMHSFRPSAGDLQKIARCDLFVHVGGESDGWVAPALAAVPNPRRRSLSLVEALGGAAKAETLVEGMQAEPGEEGGGDAPPDEHVWLSLRAAGTLVDAIAEALSGLDPSRADAWRANAAAYRAKLAALDAEYSAAVAAAPRKTLVVADRFPLRYLADDYGLGFYAAFPGCSAETEASFKTVVFLAGKVDSLGARSLMVLEGSDRRLAETVRAATKAKNQSVAVFESLQSVTAAQVSAGETYLGAMRRNLAALSEALR